MAADLGLTLLRFQRWQAQGTTSAVKVEEHSTANGLQVARGVSQASQEHDQKGKTKKARAKLEQTLRSRNLADCKTFHAMPSWLSPSLPPSLCLPPSLSLSLSLSFSLSLFLSFSLSLFLSFSLSLSLSAGATSLFFRPDESQWIRAPNPLTQKAHLDDEFSRAPLHSMSWL